MIIMADDGDKNCRQIRLFLSKISSIFEHEHIFKKLSPTFSHMLFNVNNINGTFYIKSAAYYILFILPLVKLLTPFSLEVQKSE